MERRYAGPKAITIQGLNTGTLDITLNYWTHEVHYVHIHTNFTINIEKQEEWKIILSVHLQVGVNGEKKRLYTEEGSNSEKWLEVSSGGNGAGLNTPVTWYKVKAKTLVLHGRKKKKIKKQGFKNLCRWILRPFWFLAGILWWTRREEPCCYHHGKDGEGNDMDQWQEHWSLLGLILVSPSKAYSIWVSVQILILHFHWVKIKMLIMELWNCEI